MLKFIKIDGRYHLPEPNTLYMIQRIKTHNVLNGIKFSIVEFVIIALLISPFAIYYILHAQIIYALVSEGLTLNCLTVVAIGLRQLGRKEKAIGWQKLADKQERDRIARANPHLIKDTMIITITALVPYVLIGLVAYELLASSKDRKS